ncbi:hypothetical protein POSPLADRAFT_1042928 [Postia placenta MAD-698-R-SB12]|uniref:PXA domain-containing protein n=1 Tax=Postia placenta MAD-698-R-SB12 TaxID=670580 RepID=A0A1X6NGJ2_9APHY|nr:hypothetical protein POSPLADRAFT_1042928 [Postia placenta MAD-698-R-SB12]OSX67734.1 hypothetical protein POSPLADRAFT_1042928 [Postia placenta MAD-698-R-SB12]
MASAVVQRPRQPARSIQSSSSSVGADKPVATKPVSKPISLSKRLLFPHLPADADLPSLLASPAAQPALNAELYDFISLALRAFVNPWWTKITRYDKEFLPAITRVLTTVLRALETRLLATDLSPLVFRDLPTLSTQHYIDFRNAKAKLHTSYASGGAATLPQLFHQLQPHMAISADGRIDDVYIRQAVDHILKACLPPEDYESEPERYIVREIILSVLLRNVIPRITQPWFIHKLILDNLGPEQEILKSTQAVGSTKTTSTAPSDSPTPARTTLSLQSLAIFFLSAIQSISGSCLLLIHAYRQARDTIKKVNQSTSKGSQQPAATVESTPQRATGEEFKAAAPSAPSPSPPTVPAGSSSTSLALALAHTLSLPLTFLEPFISRLLPYLLYTHALSAPRLADIVRSARHALFPEGWPGHAPPDPTPEEQAVMREELGRRLLARAPAPLALLLGPTPDARTHTIDGILDPLSSQACNAHLVLFILDLILSTVFPELGVSETVAAMHCAEGGISGST